MLPEFKTYQSILFGIYFLHFGSIKITGKPKQENLISARIDSLESLYLHSCTTLIENKVIKMPKNLNKQKIIYFPNELFFRVIVVCNFVELDGVNLT